MKKLPALDGLRGIAILMVFAGHYGSGAGLHHPSVMLKTIGAICSFGWSGVDLFFVLSGFLITGILYDTRTDPGYYRKFYARRALRIFPVFYLFALVAFIVGSHWQAGHLAFLFYIGYPAAILFPALLQVPVKLGHLWSLAAEEQFYMIWPVLMAKVKRPLMLCGVAIIIGFCLRFVLLLNGVERSWVYFFLPCRMDGLAIGAAIALLWRTARKESLQRWAPLSLAASFAGLCILFSQHARNTFLASTLNDILALCLGSLVVISLTYPKAFSLSVLRMFGRYSYGMYLFHIPLMPVFERLKPALHFAYVPFCLLANLAIAAASFHFFEAPVLKLKSRFAYSTSSWSLSVISPGSPLSIISALEP